MTHCIVLLVVAKDSLLICTYQSVVSKEVIFIFIFFILIII